MARDASLLAPTVPTAIAPASVVIGHIQLRDLIICPSERGIVNYVHHHAIVEHNLLRPDAAPKTLAKLSFQPNTLASLSLPGTDDTLLAAGGQEAEVHLAYCSRQRQRGIVWQTETTLSGSINNSVLLKSMNLTRSGESSTEPRMVISNNDSTVKFYDVPVRSAPKRGLEEVGCLRLNVPVNHSSISPDGRTLLSVGDSSKVFLHQLTGGARITFSLIATLKLPSPSMTPAASYMPSSLMASFSTHFSADGSKFAVASQEGLVAVWDVRSTRPLRIFETDKTRTTSRASGGNGGSASAGNGGNGDASGWMSDETYDWSGSSFRAPGWSVRNVKFGGTGDKEIMTFTEHTSLLHVIDARTFETEQIICVPTVRPKSEDPSAPTPETQRASISPRPAHPTPSHAHPHPRHIRRRMHYVLSPSRPSFTMSSSAPSPSAPTLRTLPRRNSAVQALGDTFRIGTTSLSLSSSPSSSSASSGLVPAGTYSAPESISDSTWRALRMTAPVLEAARMSGSDRERRSRRTREEVEEEDILVIPPLGDAGIESDVRALLGSHGIRTARGRAPRRGLGTVYPRDGEGEERADEDEDEREDEDEEDGENDRNTGSAHADYEYVVPQRRRRWSGRRRGERAANEDEMEVDELESECSSCAPSRSTSPEPSSTTNAGDGGRVPSTPRSRRRQVTYSYAEGDLDIAGTCFDPSGKFLYVAATEAVVEWGLRGSEKKWWSGTEWM